MTNKNTGLKKIDIYDRAFSFACRIIKLYQFMVEQNSAAKVLCNQLLRSGTSIGANLQEAAGGQSKADFIFKCNIALKEARETYYWLCLLTETKIVNSDKIKDLTDESSQLVAILTTIVKNSRKQK